jgi:hypothetical protein
VEKESKAKNTMKKKQTLCTPTMHMHNGSQSFSSAYCSLAAIIAPFKKVNQNK